MNKSLPSEALSKAEYTNFLQHHTRRLSFILKSHAVSRLLNKTFPAEYSYLTQHLSDEERWALSAAYDGMLKLLPEILEERSKMGTSPVSDDQQKNLELALSVLHRSVWNEARRPDEEGDNHQDTGDRG